MADDTPTHERDDRDGRDERASGNESAERRDVADPYTAAEYGAERDERRATEDATRAENRPENATATTDAREDGGTVESAPAPAADTRGPQDETLPDRPQQAHSQRAHVGEEGGPRGSQQDTARNTTVEGSRGQQTQQGASAHTASNPEENVQLDPWEIHDRMMNVDVSESVVLKTDWGDLQCTMHEPSQGIYEAAVGALPDELVEWMTEAAEEYGNDADLEEIVKREDVDVPRIVYGEEAANVFARLLDESLEHTPPEGRDKLTETPMRNIIRTLDVRNILVPLGLQAVRIGSNRPGVRGFRMVEQGTEVVAEGETVRPE